MKKEDKKALEIMEAINKKPYILGDPMIYKAVKGKEVIYKKSAKEMCEALQCTYYRLKTCVKYPIIINDYKVYHLRLSVAKKLK